MTKKHEFSTNWLLFAEFISDRRDNNNNNNEHTCLKETNIQRRLDAMREQQR